MRYTSIFIFVLVVISCRYDSKKLNQIETQFPEGRVIEIFGEDGEMLESFQFDLFNKNTHYIKVVGSDTIMKRSIYDKNGLQKSEVISKNSVDYFKRIFYYNSDDTLIKVYNSIRPIMTDKSISDNKEYNYKVSLEIPNYHIYEVFPKLNYEIQWQSITSTNSVNTKMEGQLSSTNKVIDKHFDIINIDTIKYSGIVISEESASLDTFDIFKSYISFITEYK